MTKIRARAKTVNPNITFTVQVWREDGTYVAYATELDVSSCGDSLAEARARLREAVSLFLDEASRIGTLDDILAEAGMKKHRTCLTS